MNSSLICLYVCMCRGKTDNDEKRDKGYKSADEDDDDDDEKSADSKEKKNLQDKLSGNMRVLCNSIA